MAKKKAKKRKLKLKVMEAVPIEIGKVAPEQLAWREEPHVVVALPKSVWERVKDWLGI